MYIKRDGLPETSGLSTDAKVALILEYIANLQNDLRYILANIGQKNLGRELTETIDKKASVSTGRVACADGEFVFPIYEKPPAAVIVFSKTEGGGVWCALNGKPCVYGGENVLEIGERRISFSPSVTSQQAQAISPVGYICIT